MKTLVLLFASSLCAIPAVPALADGGNAPLTVTGSPLNDEYAVRVPYDDLRLANADDAARLRARVDQASRTACRNLYDGGAMTQRWGCHAQAMEAAAPQIARAISASKENLARTDRVMVLRFARR